jgi:hypothetical protein
MSLLCSPISDEAAEKIRMKNSGDMAQRRKVEGAGLGLDFPERFRALTVATLQ